MIKKILLMIGLFLSFLVIISWFLSTRKQMRLNLFCTMGDMGSCHVLGYTYEKGTGYICSLAPQSIRYEAKYIVINKEKAKEAYTKACNGGIILSCRKLGFMYLKGNGIKKDKAMAEKLYKKACDGGDSYSCKEDKK